MEIEILFRAQRVDNGKWAYGFLNQYQAKYFITREVVEYPTHADPAGTWIYEEYEVLFETIGQLRHKNSYGSYFDGDIYYHAGHGNEIVSGLCELHEALLHGNDEDICDIKGNIHDNPELLKQ